MPNGCDSISVINLTLNSIISANFNQTGCDSVIVFGQTYTLSGTYIDTFTSVGGCDSIVTVNALVNHPSVATINQTACNAFTVNGQTYTASGTYVQI
ncbi:hypothetical protein EMGBS15_13300 [Filimonas sp.]|nr:hypothetical protein EMGBS15_13300 [Filimonas sp.]